MKAIIYTSNTGTTERYAKMLSNQTGIPAFTAAEAKGKIEKGEKVLFMGWLMAGAVKGYKKADNRYRVKAVCAVGMRSPSNEALEDTISRNKINDKKVFYLQGGYDISKLHGLYKFMMKMVGNSMLTSLEKKESRTEEEEATLDMLKNGLDAVSVESLEPIVEWLSENPS